MRNAIIAFALLAACGGPLSSEQEDDLEHGRAARAVEVVLENRTSLPLTYSRGGASHGVWKTQVPGSIAANSFGSFETESNGFMTGTQAFIEYRFAGGIVRLDWDDPFSGTNSYSANAPPGYVVDRVGGPGNRTTVFFHLRAVSTPATTCPWQTAQWAVDNLSTPEPGLNPFDMWIAFLTTSVFKDEGIGGWGETGCYVQGMSGVALRDAQYSTDGLWTIDVRVDSMWWFSLGGKEKYVRLEVRPGTRAHAALWSGHAPRAGGRLSISGVVRTDHGSFLEVHPDDLGF